MIIEYVTNQCECTSNDDSWPRRPIKPGESVEMMVTFKPDEPGNRRSGVDIIANTDPIVFSLEFTADVIPK